MWKKDKYLRQISMHIENVKLVSFDIIKLIMSRKLCQTVVEQYNA
jgi:hypothetical protein